MHNGRFKHLSAGQFKYSERDPVGVKRYGEKRPHWHLHIHLGFHVQRSAFSV
jgi:hypothetical protein